MKKKKIVFSFGRFNPPTVGHLLLASKVKQEAIRRRADHIIYGSSSQDKKKNPLSGRDKLRFMKKILKGFNVEISNSVKTPFHALEQLEKEGYSDVTMVVGADRVNEFRKQMKKYIGPDKQYKFQNFEVISAGERDPDADDVTGMSASKMRGAAKDGNLDAFQLGIPSHVNEKDTEMLFKKVQQGMGIKPFVAESWFNIDEFNEFLSEQNIKDFDLSGEGVDIPAINNKVWGTEGLKKKNAKKNESKNLDEKLNFKSFMKDLQKKMKMTEFDRKERARLRGLKKEIQWYNTKILGISESDEQELNEITVQQRLKMARSAKRTAKKRARKRKIKEKRKKDIGAIKKKAQKSAISIMRKKLVKGVNWNELSFSQRQSIEKRLKKKKKAISRLAKRLLPKAREAEKERLKRVRAKMTTNDPSKAVEKFESINHDFESKILKESKLLSFSEASQVAAFKRQHGEGEEGSGYYSKEEDKAKEKSKPTFYIVKNKNTNKIQVVEKPAANHETINKGPATSIKGSATKVSKEEDFDWRGSKSAMKKLGIAKDKDKVEKQTAQERLPELQAQQEIENIDGTAAQKEDERQWLVNRQAELDGKRQKALTKLQSKKPKGKAKNPTDVSKAEYYEVATTDHFNIVMGNDLEMGGVSSTDRAAASRSIVLTQQQAERYGLEESVAKRMVEGKGGLMDYVNENGGTEDFQWVAVHAGKNIKGEENVGVHEDWAKGSGPTSKSDLVLVQIDRKTGKEVKRHGFSMKIGSSRLITSAPGESTALLNMATKRLKERCNRPDAPKNCVSKLGTDKKTRDAINEITKELEDEEKTHLRTGIGVGPSGWWTLSGGKYHGDDKSILKWWYATGPGQGGYCWECSDKQCTKDMNCGEDGTGLKGKKVEEKHWAQTDLAQLNPEIITRIRDIKEWHEKLANKLSKILGDNPDLADIVFHEAATGCCKFCGCCTDGCACNCGTSKVATQMITASADGSNVAVSSIEKGTAEGDATIKKIREKSRVGFSFKTGGRSKTISGWVKEMQAAGQDIPVEELMKRTGAKSPNEKVKLGDQSITTTVQINTKEENSYMMGFSEYDRINLTEDDKQQAMFAFKNDIAKGKETYDKNKNAIKNINGDPLRLMDHLEWEFEDMESSEMEDWGDIGIEQESQESTEIKIDGKTKRIPVIKFREDDEDEEGLALDPEEEKELFGESFKSYSINKEFQSLFEKAPKGWEGTVKAMKKDKNIDNPWALSHWMKKQGHKSRKPITDSYEFKDSSTHGLGSFAKKEIKENEMVSLYYLNLLNENENAPQYQRTDFCRFTNHSQHIPNIVLIEKEDGNFYTYAMRDIQEGEELFINYFNVFESIIPAVKEEGEVIPEVLRWTAGYEDLEIPPDSFGDLRDELAYFNEINESIDEKIEITGHNKKGHVVGGFSVHGKEDIKRHKELLRKHFENLHRIKVKHPDGKVLVTDDTSASETELDESYNEKGLLKKGLTHAVHSKGPDGQIHFTTRRKKTADFKAKMYTDAVQFNQKDHPGFDVKIVPHGTPNGKSVHKDHEKYYGKTDESVELEERNFDRGEIVKGRRGHHADQEYIVHSGNSDADKHNMTVKIGNKKVRVKPSNFNSTGRFKRFPGPKLQTEDAAKDNRKAYLKKYGAKPEQRERRSSRTNARNKAIRAGRASVGDGKDLDHKNGNPLDNSAKNLRMVSRKFNRGRDNNKWRKANEEHGAGEAGTKELLKKYLKDTPHMTINGKTSEEL